MKKSKICAFCLVLVLTLVGCSATDSKRNSSIKAENSSSLIDSSLINSSIVDDPSSTISNVHLITDGYSDMEIGNSKDIDMQANDFLTALTTGNIQKLSKLSFGSDISMYSFLQNVHFENYTLNSCKKNSNDDYMYNVTLNISASDSDDFQIGKSNWFLFINFGDCFLLPEGIYVDNNFDFLNPLYDYCTSLDRLQYACKDITDNSFVKNPQNLWSSFDYLCSKAITFYKKCLDYDNYKEAKNPTATELNKFMISKFKAEKFDAAKYSPDLIKEGQLINIPMGGIQSIAVAQPPKIINGTDTSTIVITYYADSAHLVKAKTVEYTIKGTNWSNYDILDMNVIINSNFPPANLQR